MQWAVWCLAFFLCPQGSLTADFPPPCDSQIYCTGDLLQHVQLAKIYKDDKEFVDMVLLDTPARTLKRFQGLVNQGVTKDKLSEFVKKYFGPPGKEFEPWDPADWHESPELLHHIANPDLRRWASELNVLWKSLGRKISDTVRDQPDSYSQIYVPNPVIVPGGRFREFYYWDSYWVINGLLLSEMSNTARGMIENFLYLVDRYGMIPNGGRIYYLRRSQPPFLTLMMDSYMASQNNVTFLSENIHLLVKEYDFWMGNRSVTITLEGKTYTMNRYYVPVGGPRPEAYSDDYELAANLSADGKQSLYSELKSAAESGWDFSSRWFSGSAMNNSATGNTLNSTKTSAVIPADLNGILCRVERTLAKFYEEMDMPEKATRFHIALAKRLEAVQSVLWDKDLGIWLDYNIDAQRRNPHFYPSNLVPLWATCYSEPNTVDSVISYLEWNPLHKIPLYVDMILVAGLQDPKFLPQKSAFLSKKTPVGILGPAVLSSGALSYKNGIPTSLTASGEQWDLPNAWAPLQHMVIEGLAHSKSERAHEIAFTLAQNWITTNYNVYKKYKAMFEKYDVQGDGKPGGGGEYEVQVGFGWSNGVVMQILDLYKTRLTSGTALGASLSLALFTLPFFTLTLWY